MDINVALDVLLDDFHAACEVEYNVDGMENVPAQHQAMDRIHELMCEIKKHTGYVPRYLRLLEDEHPMVRLMSAFGVEAEEPEIAAQAFKRLYEVDGPKTGSIFSQAGAALRDLQRKGYGLG